MIGSGRVKLVPEYAPYVDSFSPRFRSQVQLRVFLLSKRAERMMPQAQVEQALLSRKIIFVGRLSSCSV